LSLPTSASRGCAASKSPQRIPSTTYGEALTHLARGP
jgi:hypothetical protein